MNTKLVTWSAALFATASYLLCIAFGLITPEPLHMEALLEAVLPGFEWLTPATFLLGLGGSFLWGVYLGLGYSLVHNALARRFSARI
jgi:hypothetical protein